MSTILEPDSIVDEGLNQNTDANAVENIRTSFAACRLKFNWLGTTKSLNTEQKSQAAESFGAESAAISAGKRLIDTKHEAYRALTSLKSQITRFWKDNSLAYPESGLRLIRQNKIEEFNLRLEEFQGELEAAVLRLDYHFHDLKDSAHIRLGSLFDPDDYPTSLIGEFG